MDIHKLRIDKFNEFKVVKFQKDVVFKLPQTETPEVLLYFINELEDIDKFVQLPIH